MAPSGTGSPKVAITNVKELRELTVPVRQLIAPKPDAHFKFLVESISGIRNLTQRDMTGAKKANAEKQLPEYIDKRLDGNGAWNAPTWAITIWLPQPMTPVEGRSDVFERDSSNLGFCLDGESRAYALEVMIDNEEDPNRRNQLLNIPLVLTIYDAIDDQTAAQHFRDINGLGVGISQNLLLAHDFDDKWMQTTLKIFKELGIGIEAEGRQVKKSSNKILTAVAARTMVAAVARGIGAVAYGGGAIPRTVDGVEVDFEKLHSAASTWLSYVFATLGSSAFRDKSLVLRSSAVIAAIGAMGKVFYEGTEEEQRLAKSHLASITDWSVGERWNGIAGKVNAVGKFSVSGSKENGHAAFRALSNPNDIGYKKIRGLSVV